MFGDYFKNQVEKLTNESLENDPETKHCLYAYNEVLASDYPCLSGDYGTKGACVTCKNWKEMKELGVPQ